MTMRDSLDRDGDGGDPRCVWAHPRVLARFAACHRDATGERNDWPAALLTLAIVAAVLVVNHCTR